MRILLLPRRRPPAGLRFAKCTVCRVKDRQVAVGNCTETSHLGTRYFKQAHECEGCGIIRTWIRQTDKPEWGVTW